MQVPGRVGTMDCKTSMHSTQFKTIHTLHKGMTLFRYTFTTTWLLVSNNIFQLFYLANLFLLGCIQFHISKLTLVSFKFLLTNITGKLYIFLE